MTPEELSQKGRERRAEIARAVAQTGLSSETQEAKATSRATKLAERHSNVSTRMDMLIALINANPDQVKRIELGTDDLGNQRFAIVRAGMDTYVDLLDENPHDAYGPLLHHTSTFTSVYYDGLSDKGLEFSGGQPRWMNGSDMPLYSDNKIYFLDKAEAGIRDCETTTDMLWAAATNPMLNPDLFARLMPPQQA